MTGKVKYNFVGCCSECGKESVGPTSAKELLEAVSLRAPSPDTRLRSVEAAARIVWGDKSEVEIIDHPEVKRLVSNLANATLEIFGAEGYRKLSARIAELEKPS